MADGRIELVNSVMIRPERCMCTSSVESLNWEDTVLSMLTVDVLDERAMDMASSLWLATSSSAEMVSCWRPSKLGLL